MVSSLNASNKDLLEQVKSRKSQNDKTEYVRSGASPSDQKGSTPKSGAVQRGRRGSPGSGAESQGRRGSPSDWVERNVGAYKAIQGEQELVFSLARPTDEATDEANAYFDNISNPLSPVEAKKH